ncbi:MAG: reprolysin-like metallopeptidase, partial [Bacteroidota bacterium]
MKRIYFLASSLFIVGMLSAQLSGFEFIASESVPSNLLSEELPLVAYERMILNAAELEANLEQAPMERSTGSPQAFIDLPTPEGHSLRFRIEESPVMHPELAARYPQIRSYRVFGDFGPGRIAVSPAGVSASLMSESGEYFINPAMQGNNEHHLIYYNHDLDLTLGNLDLPAAECGWEPGHMEEDEEYLEMLARAGSNTGAGRSSQALIGMHVYDLALVCTGEFAAQQGGTLEGVLSAYNEAVSLLNAILEREVAARFMLINNTESLIFLNAGTDPFTNANEGGALLAQVGPAISGAGIPFNAFDLGHIFTGNCTDVGGVVSGQACTSGKTRGVTCHSNNNIAAIVRRIMSHEIAHQYAVGHSWNNCPPSQGQLASGSAFEPGSGSTIMSYAGTCGNQNVAGNNDDYYHVGSLEQFIIYSREITGADCATILEPVNSEPEVSLDYVDGFFIPISTPFSLTGTATDIDGDNLVYTWEQFDLGPASTLGDPNGNAPLFRSYEPTENGFTRVFPRIDRIVNNSNSLVEVLPTYSRDMTFRLTARDFNENAGGTGWATVAFEATDEAGPFLVSSPNTGDEVWQGGEYREIIWDVASTDQAPVNCQFVNVLLSDDGGFNYPIVLAENAPNNGSTFVTIPTDLVGTTYRIKVEAADNIFFDISNDNFTIEAPTEPSFTLVPTPLTQQICLPEVAELTFEAGSVLNFSNSIDLQVISDLPDGAVVSFSANQINPGESTTLSVDLSEVSFSGPLEIIVQAVAADVDTAFRSVILEVVNNDFSDLTLTAPAEGSSGIQLATPFNWSDAANADLYDIQIATSPDFSEENLFEAGTNL